MCLYTKEVTKSQLRGKTPMDYFVRIAKRDIICYKLFIKEDSLTTPYKRFRWPEGNPVVSSYLNPIIKSHSYRRFRWPEGKTISPPTIRYFCIVEEGLHAYREKYDANCLKAAFWNGVVKKMVIPKGSRYVIGNQEIVSDKMKFYGN